MKIFQKLDKDHQGMILIGFAVSVLLILGILYIFLPTGRSDDLCEEVKSRKVHTVIIDKTDDFNEGEVEGIMRYIKQNIDTTLYVQDKLEIFVLNKENYRDKVYSIPAPEFSKCKPTSEANLLYENPRMIKEVYQKEYVAPLSDLRTLLSEKSTASKSPIFEMIKSISERIKSNNTNTLHVISDMLHNNSFYSQHKDNFSFSQFSSKYSDYYNSIKPDLGGVDIRILYIPRINYQQDQSIQHEEFWKDYFKDNQVKNIFLRRL